MFFLTTACTFYFLAFIEEKENTKDDTTVLTMVHKEPELKIDNTVGIQTLPENVELVSQLEENFASKMNNEAQTKVENCRFSNQWECAARREW